MYSVHDVRIHTNVAQAHMTSMFRADLYLLLFHRTGQQIESTTGPRVMSPDCKGKLARVTHFAHFIPARSNAASSLLLLYTLACRVVPSILQALIRRV